MMPADKLLPRLKKVRQVKSGQWVALCPGHPDRNPSMRIKEVEGGTLLVKCWAGCSAAQIVTAVGLELSDLFPGGGQRHARRGPSRAAIEHECRIVLLGTALLAQGTRLLQSDLERMEIARLRLGRLGVKV